MSGVVYLPPRRKRHLPSAIVRLRSLVRRGPSSRAGGAGPMSADPAPLRVRSRRSRGEHIVTVSGRLNGRTCAPLVEALEDALESDAVRIVLDLAELESIDHAGLDAVLAAQLRADDELKPLVIAPGPHAVQRLLDSSRGPFLYVARQDARASGRPRSRGGRPARPLQLHRARRSG